MHSFLNNNYESASASGSREAASGLNNSFATSLSLTTPTAATKQQPPIKKNLKIQLPDDKKPKPVFPGKRPDIKADVVSIA